MEIVKNIAKTISFVFSPLLIPTYAMALMLTMTELAFVPLATRAITLGVVFMLTCVFPLMIIGGMKVMNKVDNMSLTEQKDRTIPYMCAVSLYVVAIVYLWIINAPWWVIAFMCGATLAAIVVAVVNRWWKISAHASAVGGLLALVVMMSVHAVYPVVALGMLTAALVIAGVVGVARLLLQAHTQAQVYAGFANGFVCVLLFASIN